MALHGFTHSDNESLLKDLTKLIQQKSNDEKYVHFQNINENEKGKTTDESVWPGTVEFLDFLCSLPNSINYFQKLINYLNEYYKDNQRQLEKVKEFEKRYKSEDAIEWYTKDSFLYRLLNSALRRFDIQILFLFSFFIKDIEFQLKKEHEQYLLKGESTKIEVYRGQMMSKEEVEQLQDNKNNPWIINNSYLSTTFDRSTDCSERTSFIPERVD